jgi:uncharacterized protein (TIGR00251 family)
VLVIHYSIKENGLYFAVRVVPRASKSEIAGEHDGALRIRIAAPPVEGAANDELAKTLAKAFHVPASAVEIVRGHSSKLKQVRVQGATAATLLGFATPS